MCGVWLGIPCTDNGTLRSCNSWFGVRSICPMIMYLHFLLGWIIKQVNQENMGSVGEQRIKGFFSVISSRTAQKHFDTWNMVRLTHHSSTESMHQGLCQNLHPTI